MNTHRTFYTSFLTTAALTALTAFSTHAGEAYHAAASGPEHHRGSTIDSAAQGKATENIPTMNIPHHQHSGNHSDTRLDYDNYPTQNHPMGTLQAPGTASSIQQYTAEPVYQSPYSRPDYDPNADIILLEPKETGGGITYVSGGVGDAEFAAITQMESNFTTKFMFIGEGGIYLSSVSINIANADGTPILNTVTDGPVLLINLAPGKYTIQVSSGGISETKKVRLGKGPSVRYFRLQTRS